MRRLCGLLVLALLASAPCASAQGRADDWALQRSVQDAACDLYRAMDGGEANHFLSPLSIVVAFAQLQQGAQGDTAAQLRAALAWDDVSDERLASMCGEALRLLNQPRESQQGRPLTVRVVNRTWSHQDLRVSPAFAQRLERDFQAELARLNFADGPEAAREEINGWVEEQTEGKIEDLLPAGSITPLTRMVLANAVYFDGAWQHPFSESATTDGTFTCADGSVVEVPMMRSSFRTTYGEGPGYAAARLRYAGGDASMVVILPDDLEAFEQSLTGDRLRDVLGAQFTSQLTLTMPRFEFESSYDLVPALQSLGVANLFQSGVADLSGINGSRDLYVSGAFHKTFVKVDEAGTEAAAATGIVVATRSLPRPAELTLNRPFLVVIESDGLPLFMGRVGRP